MTTEADAGARRAAEALELPSDLADEIRAHAESAHPAEACGFVVGGSEGPVVRAQRLIGAENRARRADRFYIDATDVFAAQRSARVEGAEIVGVYHSHPDAPAHPSATDRHDAWAEMLYLIVGCQNGVAGAVKCWRWDGDDFHAVDVRGSR